MGDTTLLDLAWTSFRLIRLPSSQGRETPAWSPLLFWVGGVSKELRGWGTASIWSTLEVSDDEYVIRAWHARPGGPYQVFMEDGVLPQAIHLSVRIDVHDCNTSRVNVNKSR